MDTKEVKSKEDFLEERGFDFDNFQLENEFSAKAILQAMESYAAQKQGCNVWQLCPKCLGDGNLMRYNSPPMSTSATPICDVCNGAKIIATPNCREGVLREDLQKFFIWFRNNGDNHIGLSVEKMIEIYLQEVNTKNE
jgi:hypothetical protein